LHLDRRSDTGPRRGEHREKGVALSSFFAAAVVFERRTDDAVMVT